jgi:hypothetical protein
MKNYSRRVYVCLPLLYILSSHSAAFAQDTIKQPTIVIGDQMKLKISGYIRTDIFYDTRRNVEKVDGLFSLHPANASNDANGSDMNDISNFRMTAAASRLSTKFTGPDLLKAKTVAFVEFDFTGYNGVGASLRHAYIKLNWKEHEVLFGRSFHPLFSLENAPVTLAINSGAPFLPYVRNEQLRYTWKPGILNVMVATSALMNYGFAADGGGGYQHSQTIPDLTGNIQIKNSFLSFGVSGNYKLNQPKLYTTKAGKNFKTSEKVASTTLLSYAVIKAGKLTAKAGITYAQSDCELNMLGGYAVKTRDTTTMKETYATINNINYWGNLVYGDPLQVAIFMGYSKNLGTTASTIVEIQKDVARGFDASGNGLDHLIRVSPSISYKIGQLQLYAEIEYSVAAFGKYDLKDHVKVNNTQNVTNIRTMVTAFYYF